MGDKQHRSLGLGANVKKQILHFHARELIKRPERLVHQKELRLVNQCAAQRNPLLHAAGEVCGIGGFKTVQADKGKQLDCASAGRASVLAADFHGKQHVFENRAPRHQIALLKRHAEVWLRLDHLAAIDLNHTARRPDEAAGNTEKGRFAAAARPQQGHKRPRLQVEGDCCKCDERISVWS